MSSNMPYLIHTTLSETPPAEAWRPELPPAWEDRLKRMRSGAARRRTLAGLWLLREAAVLAGWPEVVLAELARDANGRPVLPGGPVFSISHSGPHVACAVSPGAALGLDVERVRPIDVRRFARFLNEDETTAAASDPAAFFAAWTAREAVVKAGGRVGLARIARVRIAGDTAELDGERLYLQYFKLGGGVVACLATGEQMGPAVVREVSVPIKSHTANIRRSPKPSNRMMNGSEAAKVLIVGGGGREHALAWRAAASPRVAEVLVAPGNAGTAVEPRVRNVDVAADDIDTLIRLAEDEAVDLTVVGPEAPLAAGIVDRFHDAGLACFGPSAAAAELEASKTFSKDFLARHGIPTAEYRSFTEVEPAAAYIREKGAPIVVKADGLAAGKGVILAADVDQAIAAVDDMLAGNRFGDAGRRVVVEELLEGEEASFIALVDGEHVLPLASSQDHKAACDGDTGPNTGGMGAYSPAPVITGEIAQRVLREVIRPTVAGMAAEGRPFTGFLYAGLMIGPGGMPRVLEFNVRLGDPETQPLLLRLRSDLVELVLAALEGRLDRADIEWDPRAALGVVMAAGGYPGEYRKGDIIDGLDTETADTKVFHAGTALRDGRVVTAGGRVLCVCALGDDVAGARERAYARVAGIGWPDVHYRRDIGYRALNR